MKYPNPNMLALIGPRAPESNKLMSITRNKNKALFFFVSKNCHRLIGKTNADKTPRPFGLPIRPKNLPPINGLIGLRKMSDNPIKKITHIAFNIMRITFSGPCSCAYFQITQNTTIYESRIVVEQGPEK